MDSGPFRIAILYDSNDGAVPIVAATGDVDLATIASLRSAVNGVFDVLNEVQGRGAVALDLTAVSFMDVAGVDLLVELTNSARRKGLQLTIRTSSAVQYVVAVTGLDDVLPVKDPAARRPSAPA